MTHRVGAQKILLDERERIDQLIMFINQEYSKCRLLRGKIQNLEGL